MAKVKSEVAASNEYPKMLYKHGGEHEIHGGKYDICTVDNSESEEFAISEGWHLTTPEAAEAFQADQAELAKQPDSANVGNANPAWGGKAAKK